MNFFETNEPYEIAKKITNNHYLSGDLVSFLYEKLIDKEDIRDIRAIFTSWCYYQWVWSDSAFRNLHRLECEYGVQCELTQREEEETPEQKLLRDYIEESTNNVEDWAVKEIVKLRLQGMTFKEIRDKVRITDYTVNKAIEKFKDDFINYYNTHNNNECINSDSSITD